MWRLAHLAQVLGSKMSAPATAHGGSAGRGAGVPGHLAARRRRGGRGRVLGLWGRRGLLLERHAGVLTTRTLSPASACWLGRGSVCRGCCALPSTCEESTCAFQACLFICLTEIWHASHGELWSPYTQEPWKRNWRMYAYVTEELPLVLRELPALDVHTVRLSGPCTKRLRSCKCLLCISALRS